MAASLILNIPDTQFETDPFLTQDRQPDPDDPCWEGWTVVSDEERFFGFDSFGKSCEGPEYFSESKYAPSIYTQLYRLYIQE